MDRFKIAHLSLNHYNAISDINLFSYLEKFKSLKMLTLKGRTPVTLGGVRNMLNYRKNLTVKLDVEVLTLPPQETYALAKEFGDRFQLLCTIEKAPDEIISLGQKLDSPKTLMNRAIS